MALSKSKVNKLLNKHIIIGITIVDNDGTFVERKQYHGEIARIDEKEGIIVKLGEAGEEYVLPPDLSAIEPAPPGEYKFETTGEIVVNPDYMTTWTMKKPV